MAGVYAAAVDAGYSITAEKEFMNGGRMRKIVSGRQPARAIIIEWIITSLHLASLSGCVKNAQQPCAKHIRISGSSEREEVIQPFNGLQIRLLQARSRKIKDRNRGSTLVENDKRSRYLIYVPILSMTVLTVRTYHVYDFPIKLLHKNVSWYIR